MVKCLPTSHPLPPTSEESAPSQVPKKGGKDAAFAKEPFAASSAAATKLVPVSDRKGSSFRRLPLLHCEQSQQQSSKLYKKNISIISRGEGAERGRVINCKNRQQQQKEGETAERATWQQETPRPATRGPAAAVGAGPLCPQHPRRGRGQQGQRAGRPRPTRASITSGESRSRSLPSHVLTKICRSNKF